MTLSGKTRQIVVAGRNRNQSFSCLFFLKSNPKRAKITPMLLERTRKNAKTKHLTMIDDISMEKKINQLYCTCEFELNHLFKGLLSEIKIWKSEIFVHFHFLFYLYLSLSSQLPCCTRNYFLNWFIS